jgi:ribosomal protein S18 acetylase RimI-like enzyme
MRRGLTACFVAEERETTRIAGFYTLAAAEVPVADLPPELTSRLPRYPTVPVARIGRLAVDVTFRGHKLGAAMLASATARAAGSDIAVFALVVDAKDEEAAAFYRHHGFVAYASQPTRLIAPIQSLIGQR